MIRFRMTFVSKKILSVHNRFYYFLLFFNVTVRKDRRGENDWKFDRRYNCRRMRMKFFSIEIYLSKVHSKKRRCITKLLQALACRAPFYKINLFNTHILLLQMLPFVIVEHIYLLCTLH